ncbi:MAG: TOBE domain-containing protein [Elusimicrobia bacterium]|nr:TOBE domain-containing protein [Elusimicrobiota bacterium]
MRKAQDASSLLGRRLALLALIARHGSIRRAAQASGLSYPAAWAAVGALESSAKAPLIERSAGGRGGGGARLTAAGRRALAEARRLDGVGRRLLAEAGGGSAWDWSRRLSVQTSARNQLFGRVAGVRRGAVDSQVRLALRGAGAVVATVTNEAVDELGLARGVEACALIKASWLLLAADGPEPRVSASNRFRGVVEAVLPGAVNAEVSLRLPGGQRLAAVVTADSAEALRLRPGAKAWALFNASSVLLSVPA